MDDKNSIFYCSCCKRHVPAGTSKIPFGADDNNKYLDANPFLNSFYGLRVCSNCKTDLEKSWIKTMDTTSLPLLVNRKFMSEKNKEFFFERLKGIKHEST